MIKLKLTMTSHRVKYEDSHSQRYDGTWTLAPEHVEKAAEAAQQMLLSSRIITDPDTYLRMNDKITVTIKGGSKEEERTGLWTHLLVFLGMVVVVTLCIVLS